MTHVIIKTAEWETSFGEVIAGKTFTGSLVTPTTEQIEGAKVEGFNHLINGGFLWLKKKDGKVIYINCEGVKQTLKFVGDSYHEACLTHKGDGSFEVTISE